MIAHKFAKNLHFMTVLYVTDIVNQAVDQNRLQKMTLNTLVVNKSSVLHRKQYNQQVRMVKKIKKHIAKDINIEFYRKDFVYKNVAEIILIKNLQKIISNNV